MPEETVVAQDASEVNMGLLRSALAKAGAVASGAAETPAVGAAQPVSPVPAMKSGGLQPIVSTPAPEILPEVSRAEPIVAPPGAPEPVFEPPEVKTNVAAKSAWEHQKKQMKELKAAREADAAELKALRAQIEEAKAAKSAREAELEQKAVSLEQEIGRYSLAATPKFKEKYDLRIQAEVNKAVQAFIRCGGNAEEAKESVGDLLRQEFTSEQLGAKVAELPTWAQSVVATAVITAKDIEAERQRELTHWSQAKAALEAETRREEESVRRNAVVRDTAESLQTLVDDHSSWVFRANPADSAWEDQRQRLVAEAQHTLSNGNDQELVLSVMEGKAAPYYRKLAESMITRVKELESALAAQDTSRPRIGGGNIPPAPPAPKDDRPRPMSVADGISAARQVANAR